MIILSKKSGILSHYYTCGGLLFESDALLPSLPDATGAKHPDVRISRGPVPPPTDARDDENLFRLHLNPGVSTDGEGFCLDWKQYGRFRVQQGNHILYNEEAGASDTFEHFLVNEVMAGIFFQRGYFLLHGSAALLPDGTAAVFFGEPGAGKSTTLGFFVKHGGRVLTDEIVIVDFREGRPYILPFIPLLRLWGASAGYLGYSRNDISRKYEIPVTYTDEAIPLSAVFSLKKGASFSVTPSMTHREHLDLFGNFPLPNALLTPEEQVRRFRQAADTVKACGVFQATRTDDSFAEMDRWVSDFLS